MPVTNFRPAPGNYGEEYVVSSRTLPSAVVTASTTNRFVMPIPASQITAFPELLFYKGGQMEVGGSTNPNFANTVTARVVKRSSGGTITALSSTVSVVTGAPGGQFTKYVFPVLTTASQSDLTIRPNDGDSLLIEVDAGAGTVTTQPGDVVAAVKLAVLR